MHEVRLSTIVNNSESRNLFYFFVSLTSFAFMQLVYALMVDSLGLVATSLFHIFHGGIVLSVLIGYVVKSLSASFEFSYGFERYEILIAFTTALTVLFVASMNIFGGIHRYFDKFEHFYGLPSYNVFAIFGITVNIFGLLITGGRCTIKKLSSKYIPFTSSQSDFLPHSSRQQSNDTVMGLPFSIGIVDFTPSICLLLAILIRGIFTPTVVDILLAISVSSVSLYKSYGLFSSLSSVLLQETPAQLKPVIERTRRDILAIDGVTDVTDEHFWTQRPGYYVGSVIIRVRMDTLEGEILQKVTRLYQSIGINDVTIQIEKGNTSGAFFKVDNQVGVDMGFGGHGHSHGQTESQHSIKSHGHSHGGQECHGHGH